MKKRMVLFAGIICSILLTGCCISHQWKAADCVTPQTCEKCGKTEGEPTGNHEWIEASCTIPKTCSVCGETEGEPLGHVEEGVTCQQKGKCAVCGIEIPKKSHTWEEATCITAKKCAVCGETVGEPLGHTTENGICERCGEKQEIPVITYKEYHEAGGIFETPACMEAVVDDYTENIYESTGRYNIYFDLWYESNGYYECSQMCSISENSEIYPININFPEIKNGDILRFTFQGTCAVSSWISVEVVGTANLDRIHETAYSQGSALNYEEILRNPTNYKNEMYTISGTIFQVVDDDEFLIETNDGLVYLYTFEYSRDFNYLKGDSVTFYGDCQGTKTYSTLLGKKTVPWFQADLMKMN